jgi:hypothetical protein
LQLVCSALFEGLALGETIITRAHYFREGSATGILSEYLESVLYRRVRIEQRFAARLLLEMFISSDVQRVVLTRSELVDKLNSRGVTSETVDDVISQLTNNRLLRALEDSAEIAYELTHAYLVDEVKLDPEVEARKEIQEFLEQEVRAYRRYRLLLTADRLKVIEPYLDHLHLTQEAEQLLMESRAAIQKEQPSHTLRVFLCHSSSDKPAIRELYRRLSADSIDAWLDEENLLPGQDWQLEISRAVHGSDVVIICLSRNSVSKAGYVQREIRFALDVAEEQPEGAIFLIPLRLEECDVPERLRRWHWVNFFEATGYERLLRALRARGHQN